VAAAVSLIVVGPVLGNRLTNQFGNVAGSSKSSLEPQTVSFRTEVWTQQYLPAVAQRPLDGYGLQLPSTIAWPYPESQYIALLIEGGYPLLIMYLCLLWGAFDQARRASRSRDPVEQAIGRSLVVTVVSLLVLGVTWPFLSNGGLPQVLWCLFALCGTVGSRLDRAEPAMELPDIGDAPLAAAPDRDQIDRRPAWR
jgi:O-antigen ligase